MKRIYILVGVALVLVAFGYSINLLTLLALNMIVVAVSYVLFPFLWRS